MRSSSNRSVGALSEMLARSRRVGAPLVAITTPDPAATTQLVIQVAAAFAAAAPALTWDAAQGLQPLNKPGQEFLAHQAAAGTLNVTDALTLLLRLPESGLALLHGAHRLLDNHEVAQAVWNLRDPFKANSRQLVLLAPSLRLPPELSRDVLFLEEPLPGEAELLPVVRATFDSAEVELPDHQVLQRCCDACRGMGTFEAEQALALSIRRTGIDLTELWSRKRQAVEQVPGLSFAMGGPGYAEVGGLQHAKALGAGLFAGPMPPRCVVRIDELEKQFAGSQQDSTGIAQDFSSVLLRCMQDYDWSGLIAVGPPGSGKSLFSRVLGGQFLVPTLEIDLGACRGSLVGESEANIRSIMRVIHALSGDGGAFFIGTCNSITGLPPELRRRFRYGAWMFDLPTAEEREPIWRLYLKRFGLTEQLSAEDQQRPEDSLWTGADVYNCCELAYRLRCSLTEASQHLLPVARSAPESIRQLRELADGRFLSASYPGPYRRPDDPITPAAGSGRRIEIS